MGNVRERRLDLHREELHGRCCLEACRVRRSDRCVVEDDLAALARWRQTFVRGREATRIPPGSHRGANYACNNAQGSIIHMHSSIRLWWNAMGVPASPAIQTQPCEASALIGMPINSISRSAFRDVARPSRSV